MISTARDRQHEHRPREREQRPRGDRERRRARSEHAEHDEHRRRRPTYCADGAPQQRHRRARGGAARACRRTCPSTLSAGGEQRTAPAAPPVSATRWSTTTSDHAAEAEATPIHCTRRSRSPSTGTGRERRDHRVQAGDQRADPGRQPVVDGDEHAAEVDGLHPEPGERRPAERGAVEPRRTGGRRDRGQDRARRRRVRSGEERQRAGVVGARSGRRRSRCSTAPRTTPAPSLAEREKGGPPQRPAPRRRTACQRAPAQAPPSVRVTVDRREAAAVDVDAVAVELRERLVDDVVRVGVGVRRLGEHRRARRGSWCRVAISTVRSHAAVSITPTPPVGRPDRAC